MSALGWGLGQGTGSESRAKMRGPKEEEFNTEAYDAIEENRFRATKENPLSTFSIDVDTAQLFQRATLSAK